MDKKQATATVGNVLARYPTARVDAGVLAVWTNEILTRFGTEDAAQIDRLAQAYCRANPSQWAPSVDVLCAWVRDRLTAEKKPLALPEPPMPQDQFREGYRKALQGAGINLDALCRPIPSAYSQKHPPEPLKPDNH